MRNRHLDIRTARDIDGRVARVHRDLGYRDGRIVLAEVRDLLRLDLGYYETDDPGLVGEVLHKLKVGAKQVLERPALLADAVKTFDLRALFFPDRKRILLDAAQPDLKKRWSEGHEVAHSLIPWHHEYMLGDTQATLSPSCHEQIEAEANYGAGSLLFPPSAFAELRQAGDLNLTRVREIAEHFGNTITSTLWRCIERDERASMAIIGDHPRRLRDGRQVVEHLVRSQSFERQFSRFGEGDAKDRLMQYCGYQRAGPLGSAEILITDDAGADHVFLFETFSVTHATLTLAQYLRVRQALITVPGIVPAAV